MTVDEWVNIFRDFHEPTPSETPMSADDSTHIPEPTPSETPMSLNDWVVLHERSQHTAALRDNLTVKIREASQTLRALREALEALELRHSQEQARLRYGPSCLIGKVSARVPLRLFKVGSHTVLVRYVSQNIPPDITLVTVEEM